MNFKHILVGLDLSLLDTALISYVGMLTKRLQPERIYFLHVDRSHEFDLEVVREFPQLNLPHDDYLKEQLTLKVNEYFNDHENLEIKTEVRTGIPLIEILSYAREKAIDLLVMGTKHELPGDGVLGSRLLDRAQCSILFVPEEARLRLQDTMVCTDFSPYSKLTLNAVARFLSADGGSTIHCLHVYSVPPARGVDVQELEAVIRGNASNKYNVLISEFNFDRAHVRPVFAKLDGKPLGHTIVKVAERMGVDLIITGSRGRSWPTVRLEGSTPQMILRNECNVPVLVVKAQDLPSSQAIVEPAHQFRVV